MNSVVGTNMKSLIFVLTIACAVLVLRAEDKKTFSADAFDKALQSCTASTKAKQSDVSYIIKDIIPKTREQACLLACFYKTMTVGNENGTMNVDLIMKWIEASNNPKYTKPILQKIKSVIEQCNNDQPKSSKDMCDAALIYRKCYVQKAKKNGIPLDE